jgi:C-terminal processing protease CtpA/Prc
VFSKSHAEYSAMGLQEATKTITIGSATAGADGDPVDFITLPGGLKTRFSGLGVYYTDGTVAQKKGVKIDIICRPTINGVQQGKDELLEKAVQVMNER